MLIEFRAAANLVYKCDICQREILAHISLVEGTDLDDIKIQITETMNSEGASIVNTWVCPDCVKE